MRFDFLDRHRTGRKEAGKLFDVEVFAAQLK